MDFNHMTRRQAAINTLAVVGFLALLGIGVWGAIYSSRYVPAVVNRVSTATVYLGSVLSGNGEDVSLTVVPNADEDTIVIPFDTASTTPVTDTRAEETATTTPADPAQAPVAAPVITPVFVPGTPHGLADLTVSAVTLGYLTTNSTDSFVASPKVPDGELPAVKFTVTNAGTNWSGTWRFKATIPVRGSYTYTSDLQTSIDPSGSIDYILGYDRARSGEQQILTIEVNHDRAAVESNYENNSLEFRLNID